MDSITLHPIGVIHSPYEKSKDIPIQGIFRQNVEAWAEIEENYVPGLKDLHQFSHVILLYFFHKSRKEHLQGKPFLEDTTHGIFAIRSPHRPNHIGLSIVTVTRIEGNKLYFTDVDILDGTPLLDIKPYVPYFDMRRDAVAGWLEKHFKNGTVPGNVIIK
jgi:tRNA-Thr(GGU) m(6)t(6)A37 methyltransferase TsaA